MNYPVSFLEYQIYQALKDLRGVSLLLLPPHGLTVAISLITTARPTNGIHFVNEKNACLLGPVVQAATSKAAHTSPSKFHVAVKAKKQSSAVVLLLFFFFFFFFFVFFFFNLLLLLLLLLLQCVTTHYNSGQSYAIPIRRVKPWAPMGAHSMGRRPGQLEELSDHSCALAHIALDQLRADDANEAGVRTSELCIFESSMVGWWNQRHGWWLVGKTRWLVEYAKTEHIENVGNIL